MDGKAPYHYINLTAMTYIKRNGYDIRVEFTEDGYKAFLLIDDYDELQVELTAPELIQAHENDLENDAI